MKKFMVFVCGLVIISGLLACDKVSVNTNKSDGVSSNSNFYVGKMIYDCDEFSLICNSITAKGIEFECNNKSEEKLKVHLSIALDGTVASLWGESNETTISKNEKKIFLYHGSIDVTEHKLMSLNGIVFMDSGNIEFDICDFELGGATNSEKLQDGESVYATEDLLVEYIGADAQGVNFKVINNRDKSITFGADTFTINNDEKNYGITVTTVPGHSQTIYDIDIFSYNEDYFSYELNSFKGIFVARVDGLGVVDRFRVSYDK